MQPLPNLAKAEGFGVPQQHHGTQRGWQPLDSGTQAMLLLKVFCQLFRQWSGIRELRQDGRILFFLDELQF